MNTIFTEKTANAVFLKMGIIDALNSTKSFMSSNKKSVDAFYSNVVSCIIGNTFPKNIYKNCKQVKEGFAQFGINNANDLVNMLIESKQELKSVNGMANVIGKIKTAGKKNKTSWKSRTSHVGLDEERTVVVRSQFGNYPVLFYPNFVGTMDSRNNKQITEIKLAYHYETGCKYYQTRPILLSTWLTLDETRQVCTCCNEKKDKDDLTEF